jgi:hypothetical protein
MKLFNYYSLDECVDRKGVIATIKRFVKEGKLSYDLDKTTDVFHIEDLDLEEEDVEKLVELFDNNDVFPYLDYEDDDDNEDGGYDDYYDDEDEY